MSDDLPERCENCRYFHRSEEAQRLHEERPEINVHGGCRRYAPGAEQSPAPMIVRFPPDDYEDGSAAAAVAHELAQRLGPGQVICLPSHEWSISSQPARSVSPSDWCGDWQAREPRFEVQVYADWLTDHGHQEAADTLRGLHR